MQTTQKNADENNKMVVDRRFDKEKELASKSAQPEQSESQKLF